MITKSEIKVEREKLGELVQFTASCTKKYVVRSPDNYPEAHKRAEELAAAYWLREAYDGVRTEAEEIRRELVNVLGRYIPTFEVKRFDAVLKRLRALEEIGDGDRKEGKAR